MGRYPDIFAFLENLAFCSSIVMCDYIATKNSGEVRVVKIDHNQITKNKKIKEAQFKLNNSSNKKFDVSRFLTILTGHAGIYGRTNFCKFLILYIVQSVNSFFQLVLMSLNQKLTGTLIQINQF